jgi:hypothetical protein
MFDLAGKKFGKLTVIERAENRGHYLMGRCICECGKETVVESYPLRKRYTKSCGCFNRGGASKRRVDIKGKRLGRLLVLERAENTRVRSAWLCRCDCGKEKIMKVIHKV